MEASSRTHHQTLETGSHEGLETFHTSNCVMRAVCLSRLAAGSVANLNVLAIPNFIKIVPFFEVSEFMPRLAN
jgi:hypothetical protein